MGTGWFRKVRRSIADCSWPVIAVLALSLSSVVAAMDTHEHVSVCEDMHVDDQKLKDWRTSSLPCDSVAWTWRDRIGSLLQVHSQKSKMQNDVLDWLNHVSSEAAELYNQSHMLAESRMPDIGHNSSAAQRDHPMEAILALTSLTMKVRKSSLGATPFLLVIFVVLACVIAYLVRTRSPLFNRAQQNAPHKTGVDSVGLQTSLVATADSRASLQGMTQQQRTSPPTTQRSVQGVSPTPPSVQRVSTTPPRVQVVPNTTTRDLCPGLVVPHGSECVLAVPVLGSPGFQAMDIATLSVQDMKGKPIIQAEIAMSRMSGSGMKQRPLVVLRAGNALRLDTQSAPLLAYCTGFHEGVASNYVYIYDSREELFAQMQKNGDNSRYVLTNNRTGSQLYFEGDLGRHTIHVTNGEQSLADTEPAVMSFDTQGSYYRLRVVAHNDVGLMLCALLSMEAMDRQRIA